MQKGRPLNTGLLKQLRKDSGIKVKEFCEELKASSASKSHWESGKDSPSAHNLSKLADLYDVTPNDLYAPRYVTKCPNCGVRH